MKSTIPQIAITGSSGFLGQYLLYSLIHQPSLLADNNSSNGIHIHALYGGNMKGFPEAVMEVVKTANNNKVKVQVHQLDLTDPMKVEAWIDQHAPQLDVCIHAAALSVPRKCEADPKLAQALNVPTVFLEGLANNIHKVHIVALSTDQVYDGKQQQTSAGPYYTETSSCANPLNVYGTTKLRLEEYLAGLVSSDDNNDIEIVSLRSSIMLGPKAPILGDLAHDTFLHFCAGREGQETTFYMDECRSVIAVDNVVDVIRWFVSAILSGGSNNDENSSTPRTSVAGVYNMGGPERVSRYDMAQSVFEHFGYDQSKLVKAEKASLPPQPVQSPLDITMDSTKLYQVVAASSSTDGGMGIKFKGMKDIVSWTFAS